MFNKVLDKSKTIVVNEYIWLSSLDKEMPAITECIDVEGILQIDEWNDELLLFIHRNNINALEIKGDRFEVTKFSLSFLKEIFNLRYLRISGKFPKKEYKVLELLLELEELSLADYEGYELNFSNLTKLKAYFSIIKHKDHPILKCINLRCFGANSNLETLHFLSALNNLRKIFLFSKKLKSFDGITNLHKLENLEIVYANSLEIKNNCPKLESLKKLTLDTCKNINTLNFISKFPNIEYFSFSNCNEIVSLKPLETCKKLEVIFIGNTIIEDHNLRILEQIPTLKDVFFEEKKEYNMTMDDFKF